MQYEQLVKILKENGDVEKVAFQKKIANTSVPNLGCTIPFLRRLAKNISLEEMQSFPIHEYYEVDLLRSIVIAECKLPFELKSIHLLRFVQTIENWAVCDVPVRIPKEERECYFDLFAGMLSGDKTFVCRYGIVNLMSKFSDEAHINRIFFELPKIQLWGSYYVDMGVAWLIATAMTNCREQTMKFMENEGRNVLSLFAYNRALQKMRDSHCISEEDKKWTRCMKMN